MKQRLISAGIGLVLFLAIMLFYNTVVFDIALCLIACVAVHELFMACRITQNMPLTIVGLLISVIPFAHNAVLLLVDDTMNGTAIWGGLLLLLVFMGVVALFVVLVKYHETVTFEKITLVGVVSVMIPFALMPLVMFRNRYDSLQGVYYILLSFGCAWGADSGAYFAGRFFGKHKLSPKISPNKTIEGVIGGVFSCIIMLSVISLGCSMYSQLVLGQPFSIQWGALILYAITGTFVGVLGDLTASVIKRQTGIKDFGSIMPGHGGVLDRFDSVFLVVPYLYVFLMFFSI